MMFIEHIRIHDEVLSGYQPGQWLMRTEMIFETVFSLLHHLTWLIALENIILSHRESNKSHIRIQ
jgi:hypothetical protein